MDTTQITLGFMKMVRTIATACFGYSQKVFGRKAEDNPIPYTPPMEIFDGKYYSEDNLLYLCNRDSGAALTHRLADLVGIYVIMV